MEPAIQGKTNFSQQIGINKINIINITWGSTICENSSSFWG